MTSKYGNDIFYEKNCPIASVYSGGYLLSQFNFYAAAKIVVYQIDNKTHFPHAVLNLENSRLLSCFQTHGARH
jgi:hypothetical protein